MHDVTKEPVETNTGASIVSTQNGNLVLSNGSVVAPEEVGGTVNEDKTISVTDKDGKLKTLPKHRNGRKHSRYYWGYVVDSSWLLLQEKIIFNVKLKGKTIK